MVNQAVNMTEAHLNATDMSLDVTSYPYISDVSTYGQNNDSTRSASAFVVETLTFSIMWLMAVFGNILVCMVIHRSRRLQSTTNYFVVSLAAADLVFIFLVSPFLLGWVIAGHWVFGEILCRLIRFLQFLLPGATMFVLIAISVDRFYTIIYPLSFKVTRHRAKQLISFSWFMGMVLACPCFYFFDVMVINDEQFCRTYINPDWAGILYLTFIAVLVYIIPCILILIAYVKIFRFIWQSGVGGRTFQRTMNPVPRPKVKMVKMLMVLNSVTFGLILPFLAVHLWYCSQEGATVSPSIYVGATWAYMASTVVKPAVYMCYNSNFRRGCREVFCMSSMKCYRSNAYTITTASKLSKKNYVGTIDNMPTRDNRRVDSPSKTFDRSANMNKYSWPLGNSMPSTYL